MPVGLRSAGRERGHHRLFAVPPLSLAIERFGHLLLVLVVNLVRPGGHDEVVAVEIVDGVGPLTDRHLAPLQADGRVVTLLLDKLGEGVDEAHCGHLAVEAEGAAQARHASHGSDVSVMVPAFQQRGS